MKSGKGLSIAALVCGILSLILAWFQWVNILAIILGVLGIVFAILGSKNSKAAGESTGLATAGLVLAIIGLVFAVIGFIACTVCICVAKGVGDGIINGLNSLS